LEYFYELLIEITQRWPEAVSGIGGEFIEMASSNQTEKALVQSAQESVQANGQTVVGSGQEMPQRPEEPVKPKGKKEGGKLEEWFKWYDEMLKRGFKCTLKDVAKASNYSYGYIKQKHSIYARNNPLT
jgi:hypothetical protein